MKKKRLAEILSIIREKDIKDQNELIIELHKRGYSVTQATVSRDISELKLEKSPSEDGVNRYSVAKKVQTVKISGLFNQGVTGIDFALNTVVIKCHPGLANAVCAALDLMEIPSVAGTIAGDDTIFVLARTEQDAVKLAEKFGRLI
ncbi:MAG: hypothetical protein LBI36_00925 [Oscillospiraceae bacterium]|jgi:transcriptional regulator of arginine metabolism|nr:hypothetical protein [Oscillospiraceae bacterium]